MGYLDKATYTIEGTVSHSTGSVICQQKPCAERRPVKCWTNVPCPVFAWSLHVGEPIVMIIYDTTWLTASVAQRFSAWLLTFFYTWGHGFESNCNDFFILYICLMSMLLCTLWIAIQLPYYLGVTLSCYIRVVGPIFSIQYYPAIYIVQNSLGVCHPNHIIMIRRFLDIYENNVHRHI